MIITSRGKKHIDGQKELTAHSDVIDLRLDKEVSSLVYFPITSPNGKEAELLVKEKAKVKVGTPIVKRQDFDVTIYSSVSGVVKGVEDRYSALVGKVVKHVVIENDFKYTTNKLKTIDYETASKEEIVDAIRASGIVGLGGAGFPTFMKYTSSAKIDTLLINLVECEPYLTTDYVTIKENIDLFLKGVALLLRAAEAKEAFIVIKKNKKDLIESLENKLEAYSNISVKTVKDNYPMGWEKAIVRTVLKRDYQRLPSEVGAIVNNAQTALMVADALLNGNCIHERVVTVSGDAIRNPSNVLVPVGVEASKIIEKCGGSEEEKVCLLAGGPMTSRAALNDTFPLYTTHSALTIMKPRDIESEACLRCGKCIMHCPVGLQPIQIKNAFDEKNVKDLEAFKTMMCVECGMCSYVCPSKIELTEALRQAKAYLRLTQTRK